MLLNRIKITVLLLAAILSIAIYTAYHPGKSGSLFYDDYANLDGLSNLKSKAEINSFIKNGHAGPLGRPVSLLTFALQAESWPEKPSNFIKINILIHIANSLLLFLLGVLIIKRFISNKIKVLYISFTAALLWGLMPILASTSLIAIQRMTSLSALFGLLALITYVYFYKIEKPHVLFLQALFFSTFFLLSIYSKESGILIPVFALILDRVMKSSSNYTFNKYEKIRLILLTIYCFLIIYYLSPINIEWFTFSESRGYSPWERLGTQTVILWDYISLVIAPNPTAFGPFHDGVELVTSKSLIAVSTTSLISILVISIWFRDKSIWPFFAIVWFLTGHLIESTIINLELYFEHRNYLAVYGISLALSILIWNSRSEKRRLYIGMLYIYIILNWAILYGLASIWGNPTDAAENWAAKNPKSTRAAIHLAVLDTGNENINEQQIDIVNFYRRKHALQALDRTAQYCDDCLDVRMQGLLYACVNESNDIKERYQAIFENARSGSINITTVDGLFPLRELVINASCSGIDQAKLLKLTLELIKTEKYLSNSLKVRLYFIAAMISDDMMNDEAVIYYLNQAESTSIIALPVLEYQIKKHTELGNIDEAMAAIDRRIEYSENNNYHNINKFYLLELRSELITEYKLNNEL